MHALPQYRSTGIIPNLQHPFVFQQEVFTRLSNRLLALSTVKPSSPAASSTSDLVSYPLLSMSTSLKTSIACPRVGWKAASGCTQERRLNGRADAAAASEDCGRPPPPALAPAPAEGAPMSESDMFLKAGDARPLSAEAAATALHAFRALR